ncbi:helix-turn-helix domain-containing protein [Bordetella bronchiseptica]|uniref:helix-turn-helix domain-containing protein n=1 Tax=Bordetella bronchiseptica TaxID=518 RepID=UPI00053B3B22
MELTLRRANQLGPYLKAWRREHGLSQSQFGKLIGLSQERISRIEANPEIVSLDQVLTVLMAMDCELSVRQRDRTPSQAPW